MKTGAYSLKRYLVGHVHRYLAVALAHERFAYSLGIIASIRLAIYHGSILLGYEYNVNAHGPTLRIMNM
jgi:hypothetical protein